MYNAGYIKVSDESSHLIIPKHNWFLKLMRQKINEINIDDFTLGEVNIKFSDEKKLNKALNLLHKSEVSYIIIQKELKDLFSYNSIKAYDMFLLDGSLLKKIGLELAIKKFLKSIDSSSTKCKTKNYLFIIDSFRNDFSKRFIDIVSLIFYIGNYCSNLTLLIKETDSFAQLEGSFIENIGLCPVCTQNIDTAYKLQPEVIFNFSDEAIDYERLFLIQKKYNTNINEKVCYIFDLCYNVNAYNRGKYNNSMIITSDYEVKPPKRYRNIIFDEIYADITEGIFFHLNKNISPRYLSNISTDNEYNKITTLLENQGFIAKLKISHNS